MAEELVFRLETGVRCTDGSCGTIKSLVVDPRDDVVTHLVVEPASRRGAGKLVPFRLVEATPADGEVRLHCTVTEFGDLDAAESAEVIPGSAQWELYAAEPMISWPYYAPPGAMGLGLPRDRVVEEQAVTVDTVPEQLPDEDELARGQRVHAKDGDIGHVQGIAVDPGTGRVTFVYLREGHLFGRRTVVVPRSAVAEVDGDGFHLDLTTEQVRNLPPAETGHPAR
jgi:sporulation protein YlmC with PRC-barrel domain